MAFTATVASLGLAVVAGRVWLGQWWHGLVVALVVAFTPALASIWTAPSGYAVMVPLAFAWLAAVGAFDRFGQPWWMSVAGVILGVAPYCHPGGTAAAALLALLIVAILASSRPLPYRGLWFFSGAFFLTTAPWALGVLWDPESIRDIVLRYGLYDAERFTPLQGLREIFSWVGLTARTEVYWDYLDPMFVLFSGAVLWWPAAVLLPLGIASLQKDKAVLRRLLVAGFLLAPAVPALVVSAPSPSRSLLMVPFAALIIAHGGIHWPSIVLRRMLGPPGPSTTSRLPGAASMPGLK